MGPGSRLRGQPGEQPPLTALHPRIAQTSELGPWPSGTAGTPPGKARGPVLQPEACVSPLCPQAQTLRQFGCPCDPGSAAPVCRGSWGPRGQLWLRATRLAWRRGSTPRGSFLRAWSHIAFPNPRFNCSPRIRAEFPRAGARRSLLAQAQCLECQPAGRPPSSPRPGRSWGPCCSGDPLVVMQWFWSVLLRGGCSGDPS